MKERRDEGKKGREDIVCRRKVEFSGCIIHSSVQIVVHSLVAGSEEQC
jgi:hypothetical protein